MIENLAQLLVERVEQRPDQRLGTVDNQITLREALRVAADGARRLNHHGSSRSRIALVASNSTDYLVAWMACLLAGRPVALVNRTYPPALLAQMLDDLGPAVVITDLADCTFVGDRTVMELGDVQTWLVGEPTDAVGFQAGGHDVVSFMHTSGTTGTPKFCAQTHTYFLRLGRAIADALGLTSTDRMLAPLPLFHINPMGYGIIGALTAGADALTVSKFSASGFWPTVTKHEISALVLHSPPIEILKRATTAKDAAGHRVRTMFYADGEFMRRFEIGFAVSGYGSTEAAGVSHLHQWRLGDDIPANASRYGGHPRADVEDRLDQDGEIYVRERSPDALFAGYVADGWLNPARDADGWFATGDLGRRDDDGGLVFLERAAESIRVKGEFVPIPYVEAQLGAIEELDDLALWKKPGEIVDDDVVLYVVAEPVPVPAIREVVAQLPAFMQPTHVAQVKAIPRDAAAGKVQRRLLEGQEVTSWTALA